VTNPRNTLYAVKRLIGRKFTEKEVQKDIDLMPYTIAAADNGDAWVEVRGKRLAPPQVSAEVLRKMKKTAEDYLGEEVTEAVITVPAYFSDAQRKATRAAGQLAGLKVERLLNEPTAAALAYGVHLRDQETKFLVFDLGGGTFDVSVLDMFENVMEVRASAGDNQLGGEDFVATLIERFFEQAKVPARYRSDAIFMQRLAAQVELAKRALTDAASATIRIGAEDGAEFAMDLDEAALERHCALLLARLREPVERALRDARLPIRDLDDIVLAGGATRMPVVRRMVARMFGRFPSCEINPDEVVALGAAVQAGLKARDAALDEVVMTDVAPYSMGVDMARQIDAAHYSYGHFDPLIERNSIIPVSRVKRYHPLGDNQRAIVIPIYQGEARLVADNIRLGELHLDLPPGSAEDNGVDVRFTYDVNGLLQVEATVVRTQQTVSLVIEGNPGVLGEHEIAERLAGLAALKIHPRDQLENRTLLARGERLYQQLRGDVREQLGRQIMLFEHALATQDRRTVAPAAGVLRQALDHFEHQSYLLGKD
jgi:molecular chaperone HscC